MHFAASTLLFASFVSLAPIQDSARNQDLERQLQENQALIDALNEQIIDAGVEISILGGGGPWPTPDPELSDDDLTMALTTAPARSVAELVGGLKQVEIALARSTTLIPIVGEDREWLRPVVRALVNRDVQPEPGADVELQVLVTLGGGEVTTRSNGRPIGTYGAYTLRTDVGLVLPARVLRGIDVLHAETELVHLTSLTVLSSKPTKENVVANLDAIIGQLFEKAAADQRRPRRSSWGAWSAVVSDAAAKFRDSYRGSDDELDSGVNRLAGFQSVVVNPVISEGLLELQDVFKPGVLPARWARGLAAGGVSAELAEGPFLRHDWIVSRYGGTDALQGAVGGASRVAVFEDDCLALLNGEYVRYSGISYVDRSSTTIALWGDVRQTLLEQLDQQILSVATVMRTGGPETFFAEHRHAAAVANFLRPRARTEVPEFVVKQLANRIALALEAEPGIPADIRSKWLEERNGAPYYRLDRAGEARSAGLIPSRVQDAIRETIYRIEFTDPIALHAFDSPFRYDLEGDYTKLPAEYPRHFKGPRPAGAGVLTDEVVVNGEAGAHQISRAYSGNRAALGRYAETFQSHQILVAHYTDEGSEPGDALSEYYFWYRAAPDNWKAILAELPSGQGRHRIGPACTGAPATIGQAESQLRAYQAELGWKSQ